MLTCFAGVGPVQQNIEVHAYIPLMLMGFKLEDLHICYSDLLNKDTVMT